MRARSCPPIVAKLSPALLPLAALVLLACPARPGTEDQAQDHAPRQSPGASEAAAPASSGPRFIPAEEGEVAALVLAARERSDAAGHELVVYVGAHWCEPCQYFHDAVEEGSLDAVFPQLRLLEFDLDRDRERLAAAGYSSRMIPLFVVPGPDGSGGPRRMQGGIKGPAAVDQLRPRLEALLAAGRADRSRLPAH